MRPKRNKKRSVFDAPARQCMQRVTKARRAILEILENASDPVSAEDMCLSIHRTNPRVGLTTVYRNLEFLERNGIVDKFEFGHGRAKYELSESYSPMGHHHHLVCCKCNKVINYNDFLAEELRYLKTVEKGLSRRYGFLIQNHVIQFHGLCRECKE